MADELNAVDSAPATQEENPSMESSSPTKTFTEAEVDAIVKKRIDKQRARHDEEIEALREQISGMQADADKFKADTENERAELASLKKANAEAEWKAAAAKEYGVPADILHGSTEEEVMEHAKKIADYNANWSGGFPRFKDSGDNTLKSSDSPAQKFGEFMAANFHR